MRLAMKLSKIQLVLVITFLFILFFLFDASKYLTLSYLQSQQLAFSNYYAVHPVITLLTYVLIYIIVTGLSLPGATIMTLAGGALFGLFWGTVIVSIASTIGATLAFLAARFLFRETLEQKFAHQLTTINSGIETEGGYYLFTLRLVPLFPFFAINILMGLTKMQTATYFWVSQIGMLPGTLLYVNAGTQLATIKSIADITSPWLIGSFVLLGIFPLAAKKFVEYRRSHDSNRPPAKLD
jgi:uncharacterized membrane protein YdjX (TVP38/TMEM64 family)